jgi:glycosyltransferase involved in cell wall biosynthesis
VGIVVDDRSVDNTRVAAQEAGAIVVQPATSGGLSAAFRCGVATALDLGADLIVHVDADAQYTSLDLPDMLEVVCSGDADMVVGDRLWTRPAAMSLTRYLLNRVASLLLAGIIQRPVRDSQSGFRVFTAGLGRKCRITNHYTYTQEQLILAARAGLSVWYHPITFLPRIYGESRLIVSTGGYSLRVIGVVLSTIFLKPLLARFARLSQVHRVATLRVWR